jgi:Xaa-Pro aminopeptidase
MPPSSYDVDVRACRDRQQRLLVEMKRQNVDLVITNQVEHVQWLSGGRFTWFFSPCAALSADGRLTLVAPEKPHGEVAADEVVLYPARRTSTLRNDQRQAAAEVLLKTIAGAPKPRRLGIEFSTCGPWYTASLGAELVDVEPTLYQLRRIKHADELALLKKAIAGTERMHALAREIVRPGVNELDVFNQLQGAAVREFGEMMTGTGNDYASGERGGPPRDRSAEAGELYILDLGPAFRGYFSDNCRTYSVDRKPTDAQQALWERIVPVFAHVERTVRPGKSCKELYAEVKQMLDHDDFVFASHLGHGIGLFPHEGPHLNPQWDDTFQAGEVIAVEPGLYKPALRAGIRLENNYLVTETGVELLSDYPLGLV